MRIPYFGYRSGDKGYMVAFAPLSTAEAALAPKRIIVPMVTDGKAITGLSVMDRTTVRKSIKQIILDFRTANPMWTGTLKDLEAGIGRRAWGKGCVDDLMRDGMMVKKGNLYSFL
jgi:hypothetical protein